MQLTTNLLRAQVSAIEGRRERVIHVYGPTTRQPTPPTLQHYQPRWTAQLIALIPSSLQLQPDPLPRANCLPPLRSYSQHGGGVGLSSCTSHGRDVRVGCQLSSCPPRLSSSRQHSAVSHPPCSVPYRLCRISDNVKTSDQGERVERGLIDLEGESPIVVVGGITRKIF